LRFIENQYDFFTDSPIKIAYDSDYFQEPQVNESLFIVKNDEQMIIKSFPIYKKLKTMRWDCYPKMCNIEFAIVEYTHPKMIKSIELVLPKGMYVAGNQLLSSAFILKQLELTNTYYVFDRDYTIEFMDHNLESKELKHNEYIEIYEDTYEIKQTYNEVNEEVNKTTEDTEDAIDTDNTEDAIDTDNTEDAEIIETKDLDESSTYSETTNWWSFLWGY
jgi:hypothetical protein